jgi:hypothetical protein
MIPSRALFPDRRQLPWLGDAVKLFAKIPVGSFTDRATVVAQIESSSGLSQRYTLTLDHSQPAFYSGPPLNLASGKYKGHVGGARIAGCGRSSLDGSCRSRRIGTDQFWMRRSYSAPRQYLVGRMRATVKQTNSGRVCHRAGPLELESLPPLPYWNRWPLLAMALCCLVMEWGLRKWWGIV